MSELFEGIEIADEIKKQILERHEAQKSELQKLATVNANRILDSVAIDIEKETGISRLASETKITDYYKRAFNEFSVKTKQSTQTELNQKETELKELKEKISAGNLDENLKKEYEQLKTTVADLNNKISEKDNKLKEVEETFKTQIENDKIDRLILKSIPAFSADVNKYEKEARTKEAINEFKERFNLKINDKGKLIPENKETYQTIEAENFFNEKLKDIIEKSITGGGGVPAKSQGLAGLVFTNDMSVETKNELAISYTMKTGNYKTKIDTGFSNSLRENYLKAEKALKGE